MRRLKCRMKRCAVGDRTPARCLAVSLIASRRLGRELRGCRFSARKRRARRWPCGAGASARRLAIRSAQPPTHRRAPSRVASSLPRMLESRRFRAPHQLGTGSTCGGVAATVATVVVPCCHRPWRSEFEDGSIVTSIGPESRALHRRPLRVFRHRDPAASANGSACWTSWAGLIGKSLCEATRKPPTRRSSSTRKPRLRHAVRIRQHVGESAVMRQIYEQVSQVRAHTTRPRCCAASRVRGRNWSPRHPPEFAPREPAIHQGELCGAAGVALRIRSLSP